MWVSGVWHDSERDWARDVVRNGVRDGTPGGARHEARTVARRSLVKRNVCDFSWRATKLSH